MEKEQYLEEKEYKEWCREKRKRHEEEKEVKEEIKGKNL